MGGGDATLGRLLTAAASSSLTRISVCDPRTVNGGIRSDRRRAHVKHTAVLSEQGYSEGA